MPIKKFFVHNRHIIYLILLIAVSAALLTVSSIKYLDFTKQIVGLTQQGRDLNAKLIATEKALADLKSQDQVVRNDTLEEELKNIKTIYKKAVTSYESLLDFKDKAKDTSKQDALFAKSLTYLSQENYASADATLADLDNQIKIETDKIASTFTIPANVPTDNAPPSSGYKRQQVQADIGTYLVDIVSADMGSTRVIVDTASDNDCHDNCPVLSLGDYVARSGAFAGVNGSYFCPATYPQCAGKTNSYDTLAMNKNKKYINSDNNVYSTVPAVIFLNGSMRFVGQSLEWGRDTGVDGVLANQPLLLSGGNITFGGGSDPKQGSKGSRSFVGSKGNITYIGVVHNATVAEVAHVLKALGLEGALNLDSGGSTALWSGGYKVGPGRNIPNAILFVRK